MANEGQRGRTGARGCETRTGRGRRRSVAARSRERCGREGGRERWQQEEYARALPVAHDAHTERVYEASVERGLAAPYQPAQNTLSRIGEKRRDYRGGDFALVRKSKPGWISLSRRVFGRRASTQRFQTSGRVVVGHEVRDRHTSVLGDSTNGDVNDLAAERSGWRGVRRFGFDSEEEGGEGFGEGGCGRMPGFDVGRRRRMYRGCVINLWPIEWVTLDRCCIWYSVEEDNFLEVVLSSFGRKYYSKARICWEESRKNQRINASYFFSNACFFFHLSFFISLLRGKWCFREEVSFFRRGIIRNSEVFSKQENDRNTIYFVSFRNIRGNELVNSTRRRWTAD